ncbi:MAG: hypothetical protein ACR2PZ_03790 [Pseudomonadales bacterium]
MSKFIMAVHSNAVQGKEDDYNQWYNKVHLGEVLQIPGFVAAQRFSISGDPVQGDSPRHKYLAIYELETDDPQASLGALNDAVAGGSMTISDAINTDDVAACLYGPISDRVTE